ncbi:hypothetical protein TNCV_2553291 [Trichonephila clavipes]|nr:hypothetical protein TNCV_2553291 [Trichonephila clavipes]
MHALNKSATLCEARSLFSENLVPTRSWASCKVSLLVLGAADGVNSRKGAEFTHGLSKLFNSSRRSSGALYNFNRSLVYADKPQTLDHLEDNIRRVIADIRPHMLEKVIENWTSRLDYIRASRGSPIPEIIFKM